jgi:hypothetical protein
MSVAILIVNVRDTATPAIQAKLAQCAPDRLAAICGPHLKNVVQNHLLQLGPNKRGWPSTHFYARAAKATDWTSEGDTLTIRINQLGIRQRYAGGPITPQVAQALTIPISPEAYGKTVKDFPGAFLIRTKKGAYIVQRGESISASGSVKPARGRGFRKGRVVAALEFLFKLSKGVNQAADPDILPPTDTLRQEALARIDEALKEST